MEPEPDLKDILSRQEFERLRSDHPEALYRYLCEIARDFVFGVHDLRGEEWGGDARLLLNRNLAVHLVSHFAEGMSSKEELPQFTVFPDAERAERVEVTRAVLDDDGEEIEGAIFYVDPEDYDIYLREALDVAERYGAWEAVPDSYYFHTELVRFLNRVVLEHPLVEKERELDFRLPFAAGTADPPVDEEDYPVEDLVTPEREDSGSEPDEEGPTRYVEARWG